VLLNFTEFIIPQNFTNYYFKNKKSHWDDFIIPNGFDL